MSAMEPPTTGQPSGGRDPIPAPSTDADETFFKTPNAPPGFHFEQETVPGLMGTGPILPEWLRKRFRRKDAPAARS